MTANEPEALVLCNVRWHLAVGAKSVHVYLDDPQDPAAETLRAIAGCHPTLCDDAYWTGHRGKRGRPDSQMRRQTINANAAKAVATSDWLIHIDADEFIWQNSALGSELAQIEAANTEINLPVLERLFPHGRTQATLFEGMFRATADLEEAEQKAAYGPFEAMMKRGQYSHGAGKGGVRVGDSLRLGVHNATERRGDRWRRAGRHVSTSAQLLHFDGLTPLHWLVKVLRYRRTPTEVQKTILQAHRMAQIDWMLERSETLDMAYDAHHQLFALTQVRRAQLEQFDLLADIPFDPIETLGSDGPDVSPEAFDAALLARNPWVARLMGLDD